MQGEQQMNIMSEKGKWRSCWMP